MTKQLYRFAWGNNDKRAALKGRMCRMLVAGKKNTVLIEFTDNCQHEIVSRRALRKVERIER